MSNHSLSIPFQTPPFRPTEEEFLENLHSAAAALQDAVPKVSVGQEGEGEAFIQGFIQGSAFRFCTSSRARASQTCRLL